MTMEMYNSKPWYEDPRLADIPFHQRGDEWTKIKNKESGHLLCTRCDGTGNELVSMFKRCDTCNGTGALKEESVLVTKVKLENYNGPVVYVADAISAIVGEVESLLQEKQESIITIITEYMKTSEFKKLKEFQGY